MAIFLTGSTGYIGSYLIERLLRNHKERLALLVRAKNNDEAEKRLWKSLQLHMEFDEFYDFLRTRVDFFLGDLTEADLGLDVHSRDRLIKSTNSVIHCAASLNRRSEKACLNVNLRGTLEVIKIARAAHQHHGLRRFSDISTTAVAGKRKNEAVKEDRSIEWDRSDYDPYARTKKFCEHMAHELLPDIPITVFRPATVLGDSRFPQTTQFEMVHAFVILANLPLLPVSPNWRHDIVNVDFVAKSIVTIHQKEKPKYGTYHLSSGMGSLTYRQMVKALRESGFHKKQLFIPFFSQPFGALANFAANTPRGLGISSVAGLIKVFWPYITFNTVFDNSRVVEEMNEAPVPFSKYAFPLFRYAEENHFTYPYKAWPEQPKKMAVGS